MRKPARKPNIPKSTTVRPAPVTATTNNRWGAIERTLVAIGNPVDGIGVVLVNGMLVCSADVAQTATTGGDSSRLTVPVAAEGDHRWRGAKAAALGVRNSIALLGSAPWIDADSREALNRLLQERRAVGVAVVERGEITLQVPTPGGAWWRLPAVARRRQALGIMATPVPGCEEVVEVIDGAPAFTMQEQLVGFIRVVHLPPPSQPFVIVLRPRMVRGSRLGQRVRH
jgi:hypothetical protein